MGRRAAACFAPTSSGERSIARAELRSLERDTALQSQLQSGHREELRNSDAKTFFFQRACRRMPSLPWSWAKIGFRRDAGRARSREVSRTRGHSAVASRWQANAELLQQPLEGRHQPLSPKFGDSLPELAR